MWSAASGHQTGAPLEEPKRPSHGLESRSGGREPVLVQDCADPPVVVLVSDDVIFAGVGAELHLDDHKWLVALVGEPMLSPDGDVDRLAAMDERDLAIDDCRGGAIDDYPVFRPMLMGLQGQ